MLNKFTWLAFFLVLFVANHVSRNSLQAESNIYNLSICAIFKDEAHYLKEWIEYHLLMGIDHFYLYNNGSTDHFMEVLEPYIQKKIVTLIDWPDQVTTDQPKTSPYFWVYYTQVSAYEHACKISAIKKTKWLALIDIDEFLVPITANKMIEVLEKYEDFPGIRLFWHVYGTSHIHTLPKNTLLIEALHLTCKPQHFAHTMVKTILKPEFYDKFDWPPHTCIFKDNQIDIALPKSEARINHYINRTIEYVYLSKIQKKEHMENKKYSVDEINEILELGNDIEDEERVIHRFVPEMRKQMEFDN